MSTSVALKTAYLGLGSNLGDRYACMRAALTALMDQEDIRIALPEDVASLYETSPLGGKAATQSYLNSVVRVKTSLQPRELLNVALQIEGVLGRVRRKKWEDRPIDIDLLFYDVAVIEEDGLTVPHPHLCSRRFVLEPLAEIAGNMIHPVEDVSIVDLAARASREYPDDTVEAVAGSEWIRLDDRSSRQTAGGG